jgi:pimeloyl-ACP methyl ester carboxylesterase
VRDAELIRRELVGPDEQWDLVGQSYGGFCITTYLSIAPEGVRQAFVTGGLPPLTRTPDEVYRATYPRVLDKNRRYFERYPDDRERLVKIVEQLATTKVRLPGGDRLTPERLQVVGIEFGMAEGLEQCTLVEQAFFEDPTGRCSATGSCTGGGGRLPQCRSTRSCTRPVTPTAAPRAGPPNECCPTSLPRRRSFSRAR